MAGGLINRRSLLTQSAAAAGAGLMATALPAFAQDSSAISRSNSSSFRMLDWRQYFDNTRNGAILVDLNSRALHYWSEDQSIYRLFPTSVPLSEELTRLGRTEIGRAHV